MGPVDRATFTRAVSAEGPRSIVLVADGEDTCAPPRALRNYPLGARIRS